MTRETVKKNWEIIKAFKNGADVEVELSSGRWGIATDPIFKDSYQYRIKPKTFDCGVLGDLNRGEMELLYTAPYSAHGDTADGPFNELLFKIRCKAKIVLDIG